MIYRCENYIYESENGYKGLIEKFKSSDFDTPKNIKEYMFNVLQRIGFETDIVEDLNEERFIKGLEELKIIERMYRVFVYGTLKKGYGNNRLLKNSFREKDCYIDGYDMYSNNCFPMIIPGDGKIYCETYLVNEHTLTKLDLLEGCPTHYRREEVIANNNIKGYIYIYNCDLSTQIKVKTGNWQRAY